MELQDSLTQIEKDRIRPYAISYDPVETLGAFADTHGIAYPLLSDVDSAVIRRFGILNTLVPEGHRWYGVPFPGTYMVDPQGRVADRSFYAAHGVRDSVARMLQESFTIHPRRGKAQTLETDDLKATAALSSGTIRRGQVQTFTLEIEIRNGRHITGPNITGGYTPTALTFDPVEGVLFGEVTYPEPESHRLDLLNETLPVYRGHILLKTTVCNRRRESFTIRAHLDYQACDHRECDLPRQLDFELPLEYLDNI